MDNWVTCLQKKQIPIQSCHGKIYALNWIPVANSHMLPNRNLKEVFIEPFFFSCLTNWLLCGFFLGLKKKCAFMKNEFYCIFTEEIINHYGKIGRMLPILYDRKSFLQPISLLMWNVLFLSDRHCNIGDALSKWYNGCKSLFIMMWTWVWWETELNKLNICKENTIFTIHKLTTSHANI